MTSFKSTLWAALAILVLLALVAGTVFAYQWFQNRKVSEDMLLAESYLKQGKPKEADAILAEIQQDKSDPGSKWNNRVLSLRFQVLDVRAEAEQENIKAIQQSKQELADKILDPKKPWAEPGEEAWARAHLFEAEKALNASNASVAKTHLDMVTNQPEGSWGKDEARLGLARIQMSQGGEGVLKARNELDALLQKLPEDSPARPGVEKALGLANVSILMSKQPMEGDQIYILEKGDTLDRLKRRFKVSPEVLMGINRISDPRKLTIGTRIKIPNLNFSIVVNKTDNTLTLFNHGKFFKKYYVRTGQEDYMTPVGEFRIRNKVKSPPWVDPKDRKLYPPDDPGNQLGSRWLELQGAIGIHEATDPATIGKYSSNGCVGMLKQDVQELYDLVPLSTTVKIIGQRTATS